MDNDIIVKILKELENSAGRIYWIDGLTFNSIDLCLGGCFVFCALTLSETLHTGGGAVALELPAIPIGYLIGAVAA